MKNKKYKQIFRWIFVLVILGIIVYTFRDSAGPILEQLKKTTFRHIAIISFMTIGYHIMEGCCTTIMAKKYNPKFKLRSGVGNAFFCSFYRVATLGSGAGVAAVVYLGEQGIEYSESFGLYAIQYAIHKISIAVFSGIMFLVCWSYMSAHYSGYMWLLVAGYILTLIITAGIILFCCSVNFHKVIFVILNKLNCVLHNKLDTIIEELRVQCMMLEQASKLLVKDGKLMLVLLWMNLIRNVFWYAIPFVGFFGVVNISFWETMAITSLSVMLAAVLPAPAGIGSTEFVFVKLLSGGVGAGLAGSASILYRFATFILPFLLGAIVVLIRRIRIHRIDAATK